MTYNGTPGERPAMISSAKGATTLWSTGTYAYDGRERTPTGWVRRLW